MTAVVTEGAALAAEQIAGHHRRRYSGGYNPAVQARRNNEID
ncbi:hypothetical protein [Mycobacterium asiaticum]|nr:hypothetical protein [Mycobacterium asiaticum]